MKVYCIKDNNNTLGHTFKKGKTYESRHGKGNDSIWIDTGTHTLGMWFYRKEYRFPEMIFENYFIPLKEHRENQLKKLNV